MAVSSEKIIMPDIGSQNWLHARFIRFAWSAGWFAILMGVTVGIGWMGDIESLKRVLPGFVSMNPMTAICTLLSGISLVLHCLPETRPAPRNFVARWIGALVAIIGLLILCRYVFGWSFKLDQVLFAEQLHGDLPDVPNRMAPNTAMAFVLLGSGLFLCDWTTRSGIRPAEHLGVGCWLLSLVALAGYLYQVQWLYGITRHVPMAIHTAVTLHLLSLGLIFVRPRVGVMTIIAGDSPGSVLARRLFPMMLFVFIILGCVQIFGQRFKLHSADAGVALFTVAAIATAGGLILWCARFLHQADLARQVLEKERERFFTLSRDMLAIAGTDGLFKRVNPSFCRVLGFSAEELTSRPFIDFVHPDDVAATMQEVERLNFGLPSVHFENRYRSADGSWKWLSWSTEPPEEEWLYAVARDVTERKQSEAAITRLNEDLMQQTVRLEMVNDELEAFSYSVSHDLRAPLRGISGFAQALEEHSAEALDETGRSYLLRIRNAAARMGELIDDLLKLSKLTRTPMKSETVDLSEIAESLVAGYRVDEPHRAVKTEISAGIRVLGDPALLRVLMDNLLGNAWKFTSKNPNARIEVSSTLGKRGELICHVRDNGVGYDPRYAHKLFGAFQRLHSQTEFPGTGIGLATVQRIVSRHGGEVWTEGAINRGATFSFMLGTRSTDEKQDHSAR